LIGVKKKRQELEESSMKEETRNKEGPIKERGTGTEGIRAGLC